MINIIEWYCLDFKRLAPYGQTLANWYKPGLSFQLLMWACVNMDKYLQIIKTV
jgi:hypothetical protein